MRAKRPKVEARLAEASELEKVVERRVGPEAIRLGKMSQEYFEF